MDSIILVTYEEFTVPHRLERNLLFHSRFLNCTLKASEILVNNSNGPTFFRVTDLVGKASVKIEKLPNKVAAANGSKMYLVPETDFGGIKYPETHRVTNDIVKLKDGYQMYARRWEGQMIGA